MLRTRVGYCGGKHANPTYRDIGDHAEAFELDFDPQKLSYEALLDLFWQAHRPDRPSRSTQYMAAIFPHTPEQERIAAASKTRLEATGIRVLTPIIPGARFYLAEDYHQKYHLRHSPLFAEVAHLSPRELVDSPLAAKLNARAYEGR